MAKKNKKPGRPPKIKRGRPEVSEEEKKVPLAVYVRKVDIDFLGGLAKCRSAILKFFNSQLERHEA